MRNTLLLWFGLLSLVSVCNGNTAAAEDDDKVIGMSVFMLNNPYFKTLADAAVAEAKKHGYRVVVVDADVDVNLPFDHVNEFIKQEVAAIVLCPLDQKRIGPAIRVANEAGIPVFTADTACVAPDAKVVSHVGTDNLFGGRQAAKAMIEALDMKGGKVAILEFKVVQACRLRVAGFLDEIKKYNGRRRAGRIQVVAHLDGGGNRQNGFRATAQAIQAHPDLRGIFAINDPSALGASAALKNAELAKQVSIVGFDGAPEGRQAIKRGIIYATLVQRPDKIGITTVQTVVKHVKKEKVPREILIPTDVYRKSDATKDPQLK